MRSSPSLAVAGRGGNPFAQSESARTSAAHCRAFGVLFRSNTTACGSAPADHPSPSVSFRPDVGRRAGPGPPARPPIHPRPACLPFGTVRNPFRTRKTLHGDHQGGELKSGTPALEYTAPPLPGCGSTSAGAKRGLLLPAGAPSLRPPIPAAVSERISAEDLLRIAGIVVLNGVGQLHRPARANGSRPFSSPRTAASAAPRSRSPGETRCRGAGAGLPAEPICDDTGIRFRFGVPILGAPAAL